MAEVSDIAVYQKLTQIADDLEAMAAEGASLVGDAALGAAVRTVRGLSAHHVRQRRAVGQLAIGDPRAAWRAGPKHGCLQHRTAQTGGALEGPG